MSVPLEVIKDLSKKGLLFIGLNKVQKELNKSGDDREKYIVFILNDQETIEMNKHLVAYCRQFGFHNFLLPKFLK